MAEFEIIEREGLKQVKINLQNETVRAEAGALFYLSGNIEIESKGTGGAAGFLKSMATGENIFRPSYTGSGEVFLEPSFSGYHVLELQGEEWVMDAGGYWASEGSVEISAKFNRLLTGLFGGEGLAQTTARGNGKVVLQTPGPIEEIYLENDKLVVDGTFAVARSGNLNYRVDKATKGWLGAGASGEGLVNVYEGTGKILLAPFPYWELLMLQKLAA